MVNFKNNILLIAIVILCISVVLSLIYINSLKENHSSKLTTENNLSDSVNTPIVSSDAPWLALVVEFSTGDFIRQYIEGVKQEASRLGIYLEVMDAKNDKKTMAQMVDEASLRNANGIMISHGTPEALDNSIRRSLQQNIPVATVHCETSIPGVVQIVQDEALITEMIMQKIIDDVNGNSDLALIWVPGYSPMEKRIKAYRNIIKQHPELHEVARFGAVTNETELYTEVNMQTVLNANPVGKLDAVWATWDEFARGAAKAIMRLNRKDVKLYGVDISNDDLIMLQNPDNPWVATAAVDPKAIGIIQVRMLAHLLLGSEVPMKYSMSPLLITKSMLPQTHNITMDSLHHYVNGWGDIKDFQLSQQEKDKLKSLRFSTN